MLKLDLEEARLIEAQKIYEMGGEYVKTSKAIKKRNCPCENCRIGIEECQFCAIVLKALALAIKNGKARAFCDATIDFAIAHLGMPASMKIENSDFPEIILE